MKTKVCDMDKAPVWVQDAMLPSRRWEIYVRLVTQGCNVEEVWRSKFLDIGMLEVQGNFKLYIQNLLLGDLQRWIH
jgi:hypothetical protein